MKYKQAISRLIQIIMILKNNKEIRHNELYKLTYAVLTLTSCQTSANLSWGEYQIPVTKVNQSSITITQNRAYRNHEYQPGSKLPEYHHAYTNTDSCKDIFLSKYQPIFETHIQMLLKADTYPLFDLVFDPKYYPIS